MVTAMDLSRHIEWFFQEYHIRKELLLYFLYFVIQNPHKWKESILTYKE